MHKRLLSKAVCSAVVTAVLAGCPSSKQSAPKPTVGGTQQNQAAQAVALPNFVGLVKQQGPTVVNISATRTLRQEGTPFTVPEDDPFYEFFRRFVPPSGPREFQESSLGSGFIISPDGYILTNSHVVADTDAVMVRLTDKREFKAAVVGSDPRTDIALVKIDSTGLPVAAIGNPQALEVGEWVAAIGAPFGFENSVTAGIVSAKGRSLPDESYVPFIQTDVAVNPGNSGGPLFNMSGQVVGINTQIYSRTGGFMGVSFAIPIDLAMDIVQQLRTAGKVTRGRIGVQVQELTAELASSFHLKEPGGALVAAVEKDGPAAKAGIMPGDVILAFAGKPVPASADLSRLVAGTKPGTTVDVNVWRKGAAKILKVTVGELAPERTAAAGRSAPVQKLAPNPVGLTLSDLTPEQRSRLKIDSGILVRDVTGPALRAGIEPADVILALNDIPVKDVNDFQKQLKRSAGTTVALLIRRGADTVYLPLELAAG
jgi:serine protease Do